MFDRQIRLLCDPHLVVIVPWLVIPVLHYLATRETIWFQRSLAFWLRWHKPGYVLTLVLLCQSITIMFDLVIYCKILRPLLCIHGEWLRPREGLGTMKPSQLVVFGYTVTVKQVISETFDVMVMLDIIFENIGTYISAKCLNEVSTTRLILYRKSEH